MARPSEPWELEGSDHSAPSAATDGSSNAAVVIEKQKSVSERIAYLTSHMDPDAPKVGNSGNKTVDMNRAAGEAQSTVQKTANLEERWKRVQSAAENYKAGEHATNQKPQDDRQQQQQGGGEWDRVWDAVDHPKPGAPKVGSSGNEPMLKEDATAGGIGVDDDLLWQSAMNKFEKESTTPTASNENESNEWQSAMNKFEKESTAPTESKENESNKRWDAVGHLEDDYPPTLSQRPAISPVQSQEQQDEEYANHNSVTTSSMGMGDMDRMGGMEMDYEQSSPAGARQQANDSIENLSLWQTFKVLYERHPMMKYYILGLLILLIATAAIIGVSVSQTNESSNEDCATASYTNEPFLLLPKKSRNVIAGGFGTSISASSDYLVVGAPDSACNPQGSSCENSTIGGGAYLYKRNNKNGWALYSSFILDDGVSSGDKFGQSVAISEDSTTLVVGAPKDDDLGIVAGAIYVMEQPFASFTPPIRLVSNDIGFNDEFGGSVSVSATTLGSDSPVRVTNVVAGASFNDHSGSNSGGVYVFAKYDDEPPTSACGVDTSIEVGKWIQCRKLVPDDGETNDQFGKMVDIAGRTIVVGAMWDDDRGIDSGAAYVYFLGDDGDWSFQEKLLPTNFESSQADRFGISVATSGERIVVGADLDDSQGTDSGAAFVYRLSNGAWKFEKKLIPDVGTEDHRGYVCGFRVDISNDGKTIVVGCPEAPGGGVAYVYNLQESGSWVQTEKLTVTDGIDFYVGGSVALSDALRLLG
eukprot:CAMPEP_0202031430 /NCGR_PEP_ID=MMETSP0905-20130828/65011_1 /ASSEMBLY_ACC=CAM_ASM_000554 /TAXON_ID=420261 /ORGANISM="Thalassiosira antarctica, Strain CCMP982" /LENGTH=755 /DNA_ID=CAMNT_0048595267 /DNA_START=189 /DNA_END=2453 /DNA_ORIENTATION=+